VQDFSNISEVLAVQETELAGNEKKLARVKKVQENVAKIFIGTGAGSCEVLIGHFTPKFEAAPTDVELLKTITKYLDKGDCTNSQLFFDASVNLYDAEPSSIAAYNLAKMAAKKKQLSKSTEFYKKAIELSDDNELKAKYYYELAIISSNSPATARSYALKATGLKPAWGKPYILIGKLYASSGCGDNKFTKGAAFWAATDQFIKAKSVDPSVSSEANKLISAYKAYLPGKEDAFAYNVVEGAPVKIGCWINVTTKARF